MDILLNNEFSENNDYSEILDLLNRIEKVNKIISLHQTNEKDENIIEQYQYQRQEFLDALQKLLAPLHLAVHLKIPIHTAIEQNLNRYTTVFQALA